MIEQMPPEEALRLLDGTTPGPWFFDDDMDGRIYKIGPIVSNGNELDCTTDDAALAAYAPDLAAMRAEMHEDWGVSYRHENEERTTWGFPTRTAAKEWEKESRQSGSEQGRIVRRYVTPMEEA